jgi:glycosyltransferase involved in cell wall biosynthesis
MGVADPLSPRAGSVDVDVRGRHGIPRDALVFAAFGGVTPEKRIAQAIRAVAAARPYRRDLYLLLVGAEAAHDVARAAAEACGIGDSTIVTGYVPDAELDAHLRAADAAFCLRWPTARETSASWLRAMAAGMPTIVTDLAHQAELPLLDPRTWQVAHGMPTLGTPEPIAIAIDILDEDHSLGLAVRRLVLDERLRAGLGAAARAWWADRHTLAHMARDYDAALATAVAVPPPTVALPAHLRPDPFAMARTLLAPFGLTPEALGLGERADLPGPMR